MSNSSAALANRLPSVVAWAGTLCDRPHHHHRLVLDRARPEPRQRGDDPFPNQQKRRADLQLLDVFGQVT